jgi:glycosyltransferase involved in cell wall biosynthesis
VEPAKISVIIPAYNAARWLQGAIESALNQTMRPHEIIVIDDGSTDETPGIIARYGSAIQSLQQENSGVSAARNLGLKHATGDWIAFLDADDKWAPQKLEKAMAYAAKSPEVSLFSHDAFVIDETDKVVGIYNFAPPAEGDVARKLIQGNWIITSAVTLRASAARETGWFRDDLKKAAGCEDWSYWIRVAMRHRIAHIREPLAFYRRLPGSATRFALDDTLEDSLRVIESTGSEIGISAEEKHRARAGAYRQSAVRRLAASDPLAARKELEQVRNLTGWSFSDEALWLASLLPENIRRLLLQIKRFSDAKKAQSFMRRHGI